MVRLNQRCIVIKIFFFRFDFTDITTSELQRWFFNHKNGRNYKSKQQKRPAGHTCLATKKPAEKPCPEIAAAQGFLTLQHEPDVLKKMNDAEASIIAKDGEEVVGYALVMLPSFKEEIPLLGDLFKSIENLSYDDKPVNSDSYVVVGQLCVGEGYRGQGLVDKLYSHFRDSLNSKYEYLITDISSKNPRSLKAHQKSGFKVVNTFYDSFTDEDWNIVLWDWRKA